MTSSRIQPSSRLASAATVRIRLAVTSTRAGESPPPPAGEPGSGGGATDGVGPSASRVTGRTARRTAPRARMRVAIGAAQRGIGEVGVDLRRLQVRVAEQLLHHAQVGAALEQVRRERVTQRVRARSARRPDGVDPAADAPPRPARASAAPPWALRKTAPSSPAPRAARAGRATVEVPAQRRAAGAAEQELPLLVALADDAQPATLEVDAIDGQARELADAHAGGVQQLEHRRVAPGERLVSARASAAAR